MGGNVEAGERLSAGSAPDARNKQTWQPRSLHGSDSRLQEPGIAARGRPTWPQGREKHANNARAHALSGPSRQSNDLSVAILDDEMCIMVTALAGFCHHVRVAILGLAQMAATAGAECMSYPQPRFDAPNQIC